MPNDSYSVDPRHQIIRTLRLLRAAISLFFSIPYTLAQEIGYATGLIVRESEKTDDVSPGTVKTKQRKSKKQHSINLLDLPVELLENILYFLPAEDLLSIAHTCHQLRELIYRALVVDPRYRSIIKKMRPAALQEGIILLDLAPEQYFDYKYLNFITASLREKLAELNAHLAQMGMPAISPFAMLPRKADGTIQGLSYSNYSALDRLAMMCGDTNDARMIDRDEVSKVSNFSRMLDELLLELTQNCQLYRVLSALIQQGQQVQQLGVFLDLLQQGLLP